MNELLLGEAVQKLLDQTRLSADEVAGRLAQAQSVSYWQRLNPLLSVGRVEDAASLEAAPLGPRRRKEVLARFRADGYFQVDRLLTTPTLRHMVECLEVLQREDWPPVFGFVYDQFWLVSRVPSLMELLTGVLGPGYTQLGDVWSYYIPVQAGAAGWPPHVDGRYESDRHTRLTVWVPLTEATLDNGCIHVIPWRRVRDGLPTRFMTEASLCQKDVAALLQACRPLPARPGSVLGWDHWLIHWGSVRGDARQPRVSIAMAYLAEGGEPSPHQLPLLDVRSGLPTFAQRLQLIARMIPLYQRFEPLIVRYLELAQRLAAGGAAEPGAACSR